MSDTNFQPKNSNQYSNQYSSSQIIQRPNTALKLPVEPDAEMAILGSILVSGSYSYEIVDEISNRLKTDYFYDPKNREVYESILNLWKNQQPIDTIHLLNNLKKVKPTTEIDQDYLLTLISRSSLLSNPAETVNLLREKYILRAIISLGEELKIAGFATDKNPNTILEIAQKRLYEVSLGNIDKNFVRISEILSGSFEKLEKLQDEDSHRGVQTGFFDLDDKMGGLNNSDMIIIACRPSMGKTAFSLDITKKIAMNGIGVAYFSLEMASDQLCERMIASTSRVDFHKIRKGDLSADQRNLEFEKIGAAIGVLADLPIWIDDSSGSSIIEIRSKARRLKQRHNIGMIVIDYLQLMTAGNDRAYAGNRVNEVADISRNLKALAKELNIPVVALSQLSRKNEGRDDKRPMLSDLRESGSIEQDADVVMFIHREDYYNPNLAEDKKGKAELIIAKNRNGETGKVEVAWIRHLASFDNLYQARTGGRIEK